MKGKHKKLLRQSKPIHHDKYMRPQNVVLISLTPRFCTIRYHLVLYNAQIDCMFCTPANLDIDFLQKTCIVCMNGSSGRFKVKQTKEQTTIFHSFTWFNIQLVLSKTKAVYICVNIYYSCMYRLMLFTERAKKKWNKAFLKFINRSFIRFQALRVCHGSQFLSRLFIKLTTLYLIRFSVSWCLLCILWQTFKMSIENSLWISFYDVKCYFLECGLNLWKSSLSWNSLTCRETLDI